MKRWNEEELEIAKKKEKDTKEKDEEMGDTNDIFLPIEGPHLDLIASTFRSENTITKVSSLVGLYDQVFHKYPDETRAPTDGKLEENLMVETTTPSTIIESNSSAFVLQQQPNFHQRRSYSTDPRYDMQQLMICSRFMFPNPFVIVCKVSSQIQAARGTVFLTTAEGEKIPSTGSPDLELASGAFPVEMKNGKIEFPLKVKRSKVLTPHRY
jgi:hypothetical protein